jgi:hypothetical protein
MTLDITRASAMLKEMYPQDVIYDLTYQNRPFFAMLKKDENFVGEVRKRSVKHTNPQNRSTNFSVAKGGSSYGRRVAFLTTRSSNYSFASVTNETILATKDNDGAFADALKDEMQGAFDSLANSLGFAVCSDGSYAIGRRASVSGSDVTLTEPNDIVNFEVGQELEGYNDTSGTTVRTGYITVTAVDREAGTFTFSGSITGFVDNDYLFPRGDKGAGLKGAQAWIPIGTSARVTALGASFFGVTRNVDETRLGGWFKDYSALPIEEGLTAGMAILGREGGMPSHIFLNPLKFNDLANSLGSKVVIINERIGNVGFQGLQITGQNGICKVYSDRWIPYDYAFIFQMDTWELASLGPAIRIFDADGLRVLRSQTIDGVDIQLCSYAQLECSMPGMNMIAKIS